jgi:hypothetical protein
LAFILFLSTFAHAEDMTLNMPVEDAQKIVVQLEKTSNYEKQIILLEKTNDELTKQTDLLRQQVELKQQQIDLTTKEMENIKQIYEEKLKVCENSKPSIWSKISLGIGSLGIGYLLGVLL